MAKIRVHLQPGAKRNELIGRHGEAWRIKVAARPVEGKANEALIALLAELLAVPKSRISIAAGHTSRDKIVDVESLIAEEIERRLLAKA